jgi:hypothetical protein
MIMMAAMPTAEIAELDQEERRRLDLTGAGDDIFLLPGYDLVGHG